MEPAPDDLAAILSKHGLWLSYGEPIGERARLADRDLSGANLREADLRGADLRRARLPALLVRTRLGNADLRGANLESALLTDAVLDGARLVNANLRRAILSNARLSGADLEGAELEGADLTRAELSKANLTRVRKLETATLVDADLSSVTGLRGGEFAQTDVTGATLPRDIHEFRSLAVLEETSRNARKIFLSVMLGCAYSWLTVATTTDASLLTGAQATPLPIIGTPIPIALFYWVTPFVLLLAYIYLHLYLDLLWRGLAALPAIFPDGKPVDERVYPWLLNCLVRRHFERLDDSLGTRLRQWVSIGLAWWVVPITIAGLWSRYLYRHEPFGTAVHVLVVAVTAALGLLFSSACVRTLSAGRSPPRPRRVALAIAVILAALAVVSAGGVGGIGTGPWARASLVGLAPPDGYWTLDEPARSQLPGPALAGRDLRGVRAARAFLVNADLTGTNLRAADLQQASLTGADVSGAALDGADLRDVDLRGVRGLTQAQLDSARCDHRTRVDSLDRTRCLVQ